MKYPICLILSIFCIEFSFAQVENLIKDISGKNIEFKSKFQDITSDYQSDSAKFITEKGIIDLHITNELYYYLKNVKHRSDIKHFNGDSIIITYSFFNESLYQINIYSNSDSINTRILNLVKNYYNSTYKKEFLHKTSPSTYNFVRQSIQNTFLDGTFIRDPSTNTYKLLVILTYTPIQQFLPLWCPSRKKKNWMIIMENKLTKN